MKKLLVSLLLCSLLLSLLLPIEVVGAEGDRSVTESAVPYDISFDPQTVEIRNWEEAAELFAEEDSRTQTRAPQEDNLIFPGPLMEKCTFTPDYYPEFALGIYQSGKANQYRVIMVYEGDSLEGEPVLTDFSPFGTEEKGFYTEIFRDRYSSTRLKVGKHTLVTCTAEPKGDTLYPIDGTAFMTDIYCYDTYQKRWSIFAQDIDTGEKLDRLEFALGESRTIAMGRSPLPSDGSGTIEVVCPQDLVYIEEAGGYIFLTAKRCGYGALYITHDSTKLVEVPVFVCTKAGGHAPDLSAPALEPTVSNEGLYSYICLNCGTLYREEIPSLESSFQQFKDLPKDAWYYGSVQEAYYLRLFNGISETEFKPNQAMTRAMLVTVLWRAEGSPEGSPAQFSDVDSNAWYAEAVNWAAENQIVNGVGHGKFNPTGKITREQMAAILYRYSQMLGLPSEAEDGVSTFVDGDQVSSWATDAMNWNIAYGMIGGVKDGDTLYLNPKGDATRAQVCAILVRYLNAFAEPAPEVQLPDTTEAEDSGEFNGLQWAYYPDGTLVIGGSGSIADVSSAASCPWNDYMASIRSIEILYGVEAIGANAFADYPALETLVMADTVHTIGDKAFYNCKSLSLVRTSQGLTLIGRSAFEGCSSLEYIDLPYGLSQIYNRAFADCTALKEIVLPDSIVGYNKGKNVTQIEGVGREAFSGCTSLAYVVLPVAIRRIPERCFYNCNSLKEIAISPCVEFVGKEAFANCASLESVVFFTNLTEIPGGAFANCTALKEVYVFSSYYTITKDTGLFTAPEYKTPFGNPQNVTLYGFVGSSTEEIAKEFGYAFVDIMTVVVE